MDLIRDKWDSGAYAEFKAYLQTLGEYKFMEFNKRLIPDTDDIIGIRTPQLRQIAKTVARGNIESFVGCAKGNCHEEIIIEGLVLTHKKCGYDELLSDMKYFADKIYNWAICDTVSFEAVKKYRSELMGDMDYFIHNKNPWVQRFGFGLLMKFYLDDEYINTVLKYTDSVNSDFYYVCMMQAWLVATAYAKCRDRVHLYLADNKLNDTTMNMTISKIRDSYRITDGDKAYAKTLKR